MAILLVEAPGLVVGDSNDEVCAHVNYSNVPDENGNANAIPTLQLPTLQTSTAREGIIDNILLDPIDLDNERLPDIKALDELSSSPRGRALWNVANISTPQTNSHTHFFQKPSPLKHTKSQSEPADHTANRNGSSALPTPRRNFSRSLSLPHTSMPPPSRQRQASSSLGSGAGSAAANADSIERRCGACIQRLANLCEEMANHLRAQGDAEAEDVAGVCKVVIDLEDKRSDTEAELNTLTNMQRHATVSRGKRHSLTSCCRQSIRLASAPFCRGDISSFAFEADLTPGEDAATTSLHNQSHCLNLAKNSKHVAACLHGKSHASPGGDVWPDVRDSVKVPSKLILIEAPIASAKKAIAQNVPRYLRDQDDADFMEITYRISNTSSPTWPKGEIPNEIYWLIADYLSRDDMKAMRLTCKEFERHISYILFRAVVVPFDTEIYGMLQGISNEQTDLRGRCQTKKSDTFAFWKNSKADDIYTGHGINVFRSFGPRLTKFGMSFEVDEEALAHPPLKGTRQAHKSYWGEYSWPFPEYQRFEQVAGLEDAADETPKMRNAFSLLGAVQELGLFLDSGLGWLSGPDRSTMSWKPIPGTSSESQRHMTTDLTADLPRTDSVVGGILVDKEDHTDHECFEQYPIVPNSLSKLQKEWLLETEWAQRAFLSSYLVAIMDSRTTFCNVHTVNFARVSSRFLNSLGRDDFWNALPNVHTVNIQVVADWRDITKDTAGFVETPPVSLSTAMVSFQKLLTDMIAPRRRIKCLQVGWACGGEMAAGLHARNKHLMPAPVLPQQWMRSAESMSNDGLLAEIIKFRHVEKLTLKNCWMPPKALILLVMKHESLIELTLDSVSLCAPLVLHLGNNQQHQQITAHMGMALPPVPAGQANGQHAQGGLQWMFPPSYPVLTHHNAQMIPNQAMSMPGPAPGALIPGPATNPAPWFGQHRPGSWPYVIDAISPGATLASHGSTTSPINVVNTNRNAKLRVLSLSSCGYACLHNPRFDESAIQLPPVGGSSSWFTRRFAALSKVMMATKSLITAEIVQCIPQMEAQALKMGFNCRMGWPASLGDSDDDNNVEAAMYDGCLPGGTGRFSGTVTIDSRAIPQKEDN